MEPWKKNLSVLWFTQVLTLMGWAFADPFIPYYLQELGMTDPATLRLWVGLISSISSLVMAFAAPVWGILADRFGCKLMVVRSMVSAALFLSLMSVTRRPELVFGLRVLAGLFTGSVPATATLVAAGTPTEKLSSSLGFLASSTFIGLTMGPMFGGLAADLLGYRVSFLIGGLIVGVACVLVMALVQDVKIEKGTARRKLRFDFRMLLRPPFIGLLAVLFLVRFAQMIPGPFVALFIQELHGGIEGAASVNGTISAVAALATALSAVTIVRMADRVAKRRMIALCLGLSGAIGLPVFLSGNLWTFAALRVASIFFFGALEPMLQSALGGLTEPENRGTVFGVFTTVASLGWFASPLAGSAVSIAFGIPYTFLASSLVLVGTFCLLVLQGRLRRRVGSRVGSA